MTNEENIQQHQDKGGEAAAALVRLCLHHVHVGRLDCEDKFIVYHNRAGGLSDSLALEMGMGLEKWAGPGSASVSRGLPSPGSFTTANASP
jgi:hypothetical protein